MPGNGGWPVWTTSTTSATNSYIYGPVTTGMNMLPFTASSGHVPSYDPPALAEDELAWLRRRVTEVTDLFPAAA
jgi:hypothetical protein